MSTFRRKRMGPRNYFIAAVVLLAVSAVSSPVFAKEFRGITSNKIVGTWQFKDPVNGQQKLKFLKDGTYELDFNGDGKKDIWGEYRQSQDWVIMNDIGGDFVFDCGQQGAYRFEITNDVLKFHIMGDQCQSRTQAMSVDWVRVQEHDRVVEPPIMMKI